MYNNKNNNNKKNKKCLFIKTKKRLKVLIYIACLISYSVKKMLRNSVLVSVKVICCF